MSGVVGLHHVQLSSPVGSEEGSRWFYGVVLGLVEVTKPPVLARRGGVWFRSPGIEVHIGVEEDFRPARKAHPGLLVSGLPELARRLAEHGVEVRWDADFPGFDRCYVDDPHGNRLELLEPVSRASSADRGSSRGRTSRSTPG